jgi:hypothetical protein
MEENQRSLLLYMDRLLVMELARVGFSLFIK